MDITVVCEDRYRDYAIDVFGKHENSDWKLSQFCAWQGENYASVYDGAKEYKGVKILPISDLSAKDHILAIGINTGYLSQIMRALHDRGIERYSAVRWFDIHSKSDFLKKLWGGGEYSFVSFDLRGGKSCLGEIQVHVTDNCNLNCKACTHFSPFVKERRTIDLNQFANDIKRLKELFSYLYVFHLMGGEPLLEPEICTEMIKMVRHSYPDCSINLITNGTLIDRMKDEFWSFLRENRVTVRVSVYPPVAPKVDRIEEILSEHDIQYICEISNKIEFEKYFAATRESDAYENMKRCHGRGCYSLYQGRICKCPSPMYVKDAAPALEKEGVSGDWLWANDAVDIYKESNGWEIIEKLEKPCEFCKRCDMSNLVSIPWETVQGKPKLTDWFIDCK